MDNAGLKKVYDQAHTDGDFFSYSSFPEQYAILGANSIGFWRGKTVLDLGCGTGELAAMIAAAGAKKVVGLDFSDIAIEEAWQRFSVENLTFKKGSLDRSAGMFDVVVMCGVLEHFDSPTAMIAQIVRDNLLADGVIISSSPGHCNPRGIIWLTLKTLLGAVMSKTDLHEIMPHELQAWCNENLLRMECMSTYQELGMGTDMVEDLRRRIPLAMSDAGLKVEQRNVDELLEKIKFVCMTGYQPTNLSGGAIIYKISRQPDSAKLNRPGLVMGGPSGPGGKIIQ